MSKQKKINFNFSKVVMPSFDGGKIEGKVTPVQKVQKRKQSPEKIDDACIDIDDWPDDLDFAVPEKKTTINNLCSLLKACEPEKATDLVVSKQKQQDLFTWLTLRAKHGSPSILVIFGPSGCGKTQAIRVLAKERGFDIVEWISPLDPVMDENFRIMRQGDKFEEFLVRATRYNSIFGHPARRILLVKDIPNVYVENKNQFFSLLERYNQMGKEPLVFIVTDTGNSRLLQSLFPENVRELHKIDLINVNAATPTAMKNMCKRASTILNSKGCEFINVTQKAIDEVLANNIGDARSALLNLIFCSLKVPNGKSKQCESREETLGLLHGIGRVINPKRTINGDSWKFVHDPDDIAVYFRSQAKGFLYFLHANYLNTMRNIEEVCMAASVLSLADTINKEWRDPTLGSVILSICIRGVMVANEKPVPGWNPVRKPRNNELDIKRNWEAAEVRFYQKIIGKQPITVANSTPEIEDVIIE